jgi:hypothetical protein
MYNGWLPDAALGIEGNSKECWEMAMSGLTKLAKLIAAFAAVISIMFAATTPSQAQTGTVRINVVKAGFIVGAGGGSGTLTFRGHTYPLSIGGLSLGTLGVSSASLVGTASNLHRASDIAGTYGAAGAGLAFVGGGQVATLQNQRGVVLTLRGAQVGFQATLGVGGMTIALR